MVPNRLHKFVETFAYGRRTGRVAYVMGMASLPKAMAGAEWAEDKKFNAAEELLAQPNLKAVFKTALEKGCAVRTVK
jgi:hypothetical protein